MTNVRKLCVAAWMIALSSFTLGCGGPESLDGTPAVPADAGGMASADATAGGGGGAAAGDVKLQIPDRPVAGKIHGQDFQPTKFELSGGQLEFSVGDAFIPDFQFQLMLNTSGGGGLDGQTFEVTDPEQFIKPSVHVRWKSAGSDFGETGFVGKYLMKVEFGQSEKRRLPGGIVFRSLDEGNATELAGRFVVELGPDLTKPPTEEDAPFVFGRVALKGADEFKLSAGFVGGPKEGRVRSNSAGTEFSPGGGGSVTSLTFKPQITSLNSSEKFGLNFRHLVLQPGTYFVYVQWDEAYVDGRWVEVGEAGQVTADLEVDAGRRGNIEVRVADAGAETVVMLTPLGKQQELPPDAARFGLAARLKLMKKPEGGKAEFAGLNAGRYLVQAGKQSVVAEVTAGETAMLELPAAE